MANFKWLVFKLADYFFYMIEAAVELFIKFFGAVIVFFASSIPVWSLFIGLFVCLLVSISLLTFSLVKYYFLDFIFFFFCLFVFSYISLIFLKIIILHSLSGNM